MFIQIGDLYINQDHIESIVVEDDCVKFHMDTAEGRQWPVWIFEGEKRQAILDWLEDRAEVSVVC